MIKLNFPVVDNDRGVPLPPGEHKVWVEEPLPFNPLRKIARLYHLNKLARKGVKIFILARPSLTHSEELNNMGRKTGMVDCKGNDIRDNDIISIIHNGEENSGFRSNEREFRYRVTWVPDAAAYKTDYGYLGDIKKDPNFIRCEVLGTDESLLKIYQGYPPGYTDKDYERDFGKNKQSS